MNDRLHDRPERKIQGNISRVWGRQNQRYPTLAAHPAVAPGADVLLLSGDANMRGRGVVGRGNTPFAKLVTRTHHAGYPIGE